MAGGEADWNSQAVNDTWDRGGQTERDTDSVYLCESSSAPLLVTAGVEAAGREGRAVRDSWDRGEDLAGHRGAKFKENISSGLGGPM